MLCEGDGGTSRDRDRLAVHPGGSRCAYALAEHSTADMSGGVLAPQPSLACAASSSAHGACALSAPWSSNPELRATHWRCLNCKGVTPKVVGTCTKCGSHLQAMMPYIGGEEAAAVDENAQRTSYGRSLLYSQSAAQVDSEAVPLAPGVPGYREAVFASLTTTFSMNRADRRVEPKIREGANLFDGWLAVVTSGRLRVWTGDDIRKFVNDDDAAALCTEFVLSHGRVLAVDGHADPVQVGAHNLEALVCLHLTARNTYFDIAPLRHSVALLHHSAAMRWSFLLFLFRASALLQSRLASRAGTSERGLVVAFSGRDDGAARAYGARHHRVFHFDPA